MKKPQRKKHLISCEIIDAAKNVGNIDDKTSALASIAQAAKKDPAYINDTVLERALALTVHNLAESEQSLQDLPSKKTTRTKKKKTLLTNMLDLMSTYSTANGTTTQGLFHVMDSEHRHPILSQYPKSCAHILAHPLFEKSSTQVLKLLKEHITLTIDARQTLDDIIECPMEMMRISPRFLTNNFHLTVSGPIAEHGTSQAQNKYAQCRLAANMAQLPAVKPTATKKPKQQRG